MATVEDIVAAATKLPPDQFLRLRKKLDRLERQLWNSQSRAAAQDMKAAGTTDRDIDNLVTRRRRIHRATQVVRGRN